MDNLDIEAAYEFLHNGNVKEVSKNAEENAYRFLFECCNTNEKDLSIVEELEREGVKCFINELAGIKHLNKEHISKSEYIFELLVLNEDYKKGLSIWCKISGENFDDYYEEVETVYSEDLSSLVGHNKTDHDITDAEWQEFVSEKPKRKN